MKYRVHIYATVRVPVEVEEAENHQQAIEAAREACDLNALLSHQEYEYADEVTSYLVDEDGDDEHTQTRLYDADGKPDNHARPVPLVVEFHYSDGDIGAYNDDIEAAYKLWREFAASNPELHKPTHILIRPE